LFENLTNEIEKDVKCLTTDDRFNRDKNGRAPCTKRKLEGVSKRSEQIKNEYAIIKLRSTRLWGPLKLIYNNVNHLDRNIHPSVSTIGHPQITTPRHQGRGKML
jgi:hypothetical protein